jgi:hypothetical protein
MGTRHSQHVRADGDFYCEPDWVADALFRQPLPWGPVHDLCVGHGTIVNATLHSRLKACGADIGNRAGGRFLTLAFLADKTICANLVTNLSYRLANAILAHAVDQVPPNGCLAVLVPIGFRASQGRHTLFAHARCELVLVLSRRPSLPPGMLLEEHGKAIRGEGSAGFVGAVRRRNGEPGSTQVSGIAP